MTTEKRFLQQLKDLSRLCGWRAYHTLDSRGSDPGFPDLVLVRSPELVFAELKTEKGLPTPDQEAWLQALSNCTAHQTRLWRPSDWPEIEATLLQTPPLRGRGKTYGP